jgi:hypothetical protein
MQTALQILRVAEERPRTYTPELSIPHFRAADNTKKKKLIPAASGRTRVSLSNGLIVVLQNTARAIMTLITCHDRVGFTQYGLTNLVVSLPPSRAVSIVDCSGASTTFGRL